MGMPTSLPGPIAQPESPSTPILSAKSLIGFATRLVQPPSIVYVTIDDVLNLTMWNSLAGLTLMVVFRLLRADGQIIVETSEVIPPATRQATEVQVSLTEGFLLSVWVQQVVGTPLRGQMWIQASIAQRGAGTGQITQPLFCDYLSLPQGLGWPGGRQISSVEGPGLITTVTVIGQNAQLPYTLTVPLNMRWVLHSMSAQLATSPVVSNRTPTIRLRGAGGVSIYEAQSSISQPANVQIDYSFANVGIQAPAASLYQIVPIPTPLPLAAGGSIDLEDFGSGAGDTWNTISTTYEEWFDPTS